MNRLRLLNSRFFLLSCLVPLLQAQGTDAEQFFESKVRPILANNCAQGGCHATMAPKEGMSLTSTRAFDSLVGVTAAQCDDGRQRVEPGNVAGSYLIDKLLGVDLCKGTRMPKAGQSLPEDDIETIGAWICNGAPDN